MSNAIRKIERNTVKTRIRKETGNINAFETAWKDYREKKYVIKDEEGNVIVDNTPRNTMPKKQQHFDSMEQYTRLFAWADELKMKREVKETDEQ